MVVDEKRLKFIKYHQPSLQQSHNISNHIEWWNRFILDGEVRDGRFVSHFYHLSSHLIEENFLFQFFIL